MKFQVFGDIVTPVRFESSEISVSLARILEVLQKLENAGIIRPDDVLGTRDNRMVNPLLFQLLNSTYSLRQVFPIVRLQSMGSI